MFKELIKDLTPKEFEILFWVNRRLVAKDIADKMGISYHSVTKYHMANIYKKLKITGLYKKRKKLMDLLEEHMKGQ